MEYAEHRHFPSLRVNAINDHVRQPARHPLAGSGLIADMTKMGKFAQTIGR